MQKNFISFGAYVTMFPQLIAGPIVRYTDVDSQLNKRTLSVYKFGQGVSWFLRGLGKKVLLANNIGMTYDAIAAILPSERSALTAWIGCIAYAMQIYFDFGGYSDMAIGLGKMFGFEFIKNFDYPYISKVLLNFGEDGIFRLVPGSVNMYISPLGETEFRRKSTSAIF